MWSSRVLAVALCATLAACGFKLRGQQTFPFETINVPSQTPLGVQRQRNIAAASERTKVVPSPTDAEAVLSVLTEQQEKVILSLNSQGQVREYQLRTWPWLLSDRITFSCCSVSTLSTASASVGEGTTFVRSLAAAMLRWSCTPSGVWLGTLIVSNGNVCWPRSLKPQAASVAQSATASTLDDHIHQPPGHHHHLLRRLAVRVPADGVVFERKPLQRRAVGGLRRAHVAAQLAVHLQHELDLVGLERGLVDLGPGRRHKIVGIPELSPQRVCDVRGDRRHDAKQNRDPFVQDLRIPLALRGARIAGQIREGVVDLHRTRSEVVELHPGDVVVVRLLEVEMDLTAHGRELGIAARPIRRIPVRASALRFGPQPFRHLVSEGPHTIKEPRRSLDSRIRPFERLLRRAGEDDEEARGVGAVAVDQLLRVDAVPARLRHRRDPSVLDRPAVGLRPRTGYPARVVLDDVELFRREERALPLAVDAEEDMVQHHPLGEEVGERLV